MSNLRQFLSIVIGVILTGVCFAQVTLGLFDGDSNRIGTLLAVPDADESALHMITTDGYLIKLEPGSGYIRLHRYDGSPTPVWFESDDCSGQAYIDFNDGLSEWMHPRGGELFQLGWDVSSPIFAKVEWGARFHPSTYRSSIEPHRGECTLEDANRTLVPISYVKPSDYNIKVLNLGAYGFRPPITAKAESVDGIFCSGFENCLASPAD